MEQDQERYRRHIFVAFLSPGISVQSGALNDTLFLSVPPLFRSLVSFCPLLSDVALYYRPIGLYSCRENPLMRSLRSCA